MKKICLVGKTQHRNYTLMEDGRGLVLLGVRVSSCKVPKWSKDNNKSSVYLRLDKVNDLWLRRILEAIEKKVDGRSKKRLLNMLEAARIYKEL